MRIGIVTPASPGSLKGNRVTALRWAGLLRQLGHDVEIAEADAEVRNWEVLIALHARKSAPSVRSFAERHPGKPIVVAMAGTDLYQDLETSPETLAALELAHRIVVLQPLAIEALPASLRARARAVIQSASAPPGPPPAPREDAFEVCVLGHLRPVKDPLLAARAARALKASSRVLVLHAGEALAEADAAAARGEMLANPRYRWLGGLSRLAARRLLAGSRLLLVTSRLEGGANAVSEAIACGVPILSTRIPGSVGVLGEDYPGTFPAGDAPALALLLERCEEEPAFLAELGARIRGLRPLVEPVRERRALRRLLLELLPEPDAGRFRLTEAHADRGRTGMIEAVSEGLSGRPRRLPCRYFYDDEGSLLFEAICRLEEYTLARDEVEILRERSAEMAERLVPGTAVAELGGGTGAKTRWLVEALLARDRRLHWLQVDISRGTLEESARTWLHAYPGLTVHAVHGEYQAALPHLEALAPKLVLWLGSNIGNLDRAAAVRFLARLAPALGREDRLLVGIDLRKDRAALLRAYDDGQGITARFNKNLLLRLDRELDADFDPDAFRHLASYDEAGGRVQMFLVARRAMRVTIKGAGAVLDLEAGEAIHTEDSYKYSHQEIAELAERSGFGIERLWTDSRARFASVLLKPAGGAA